ncbi:AAA family ATPase [Streptomyces sp. NPDC001339]|uniref:helix-turn-helix transcriptional regulator n=1 Tax=Streptomyces sp. NPDC001339 TaxID=3364563 RepID=UPI0036A70178
MGEASSMSLVDRERELETLKQLFSDCVEGNGAGAIVSGPIGSGKTGLLQVVGDFVTGAGAHFLYVGARAGGPEAFGCLRELCYAAQRLLVKDCDAADALLCPAPGADLSPSVGYGLMTELVQLSDRTPLVVAVDDLEHVDTPSLQCLLHLAQRIRTSRILLLLAVRQHARATSSVHAEFFRQQHFAQLRLATLTERGVARMLADRLGTAEAERLAPAVHATSGGNPLLVRALIDDHRPDAGEPAGAGITPGESFRCEVWACIQRGDPEMLEVAHGVGVLGKAPSSKLVWRLLGTVQGGHLHAMQELVDAGLVHDGHFRHPAAAAAVTGAMNPARTAELHARAARLLHAEGERAPIVAGHIVAGGQGGEPWALDILQEAAEQAIAGAEGQRAVEYLEQALGRCTDDARRATLLALHARVEWQTAPAKVARRLPLLQDASHKGHLDDRQTGELARYLLWYGRVEEAAQVMARLDGSASAQAAAELAELTAWLRVSYPHACEAVPALRALARTSADAPCPVTPAGVLMAALKGNPDGDAVAHAERILQSSRVGETPLESVEAAAFALIHLGRLDSVTHWCELLQEEAAARSAATWQALLSWIRAEVGLRRGDLARARSHAEAALRHISWESWGVVGCGPLATLLLGLSCGEGITEPGAEPAHPVPPAALQTRYGVTYLRARGYFYLTTDRLQAGLADFLRCGELLTRWDLDLPALIPWRMDAAEAQLALGEREEAKKFAAEHEALARRGEERTRGIALRVLAAATDLRKRPALLREAMELLRLSGDRYELSRTLELLGDAYHALGDSSRARMIGAGVTHITSEHPPRARQSGTAPADRRPQQCSDNAVDQSVAGLSDAEWRVARLATIGYTNREISNKLFITVSTVEQHLTRIYRKLNVSRRADLPAMWSPDYAAEPAC